MLRLEHFDPKNRSRPGEGCSTAEFGSIRALTKSCSIPRSSGQFTSIAHTEACLTGGNRGNGGRQRRNPHHEAGRNHRIVSEAPSSEAQHHVPPGFCSLCFLLFQFHTTHGSCSRSAFASSSYCGSEL